MLQIHLEKKVKGCKEIFGNLCWFALDEQEK